MISQDPCMPKSAEKIDYLRFAESWNSRFCKTWLNSIIRVPVDNILHKKELSNENHSYFYFSPTLAGQSG